MSDHTTVPDATSTPQDPPRLAGGSLAPCSESSQPAAVEERVDDVNDQPPDQRELPLRRVNAELERQAEHLTLLNKTLTESEQRLRLAIETGKIGLWVWNSTDLKNSGDWSNQLKEIFGLPLDAEVTHDMFLKCVHPDDRLRVDHCVRQALGGVDGGEYSTDYRTISPRDGAEHWVTARGRAFFDSTGRAVRFIGAVMDITERKRAEESVIRLNAELEERIAGRTADLARSNQALQSEIEERKWVEALLAAENRVLEMIARGSPHASVLDALCKHVEELSPGAFASVLTLDRNSNRLYFAAAPSLPPGYVALLDDGMVIGPSTASCGAAAYLGKPVISADIATDPRWAEYRELALSHGLRASWSTPIYCPEGNVVGTFGIYSRKPGGPSPREEKLISQFTHLASVAMERQRAEDALCQSEAYLAEAQRLSLMGSFGWKGWNGELVWSEETARILGYEPTTVPSLEHARQRIHPDDRSSVEAILDRAARELGDLDFEHRLLMPDRSVKHVRVVARAAGSEPRGPEFVGAVMDVTAQKRAEETLRASELLARGQLHALTRMLDRLASDSEPDELLGHVLRTIIEQLDAHSSSVWRRQESGGKVTFEFDFECDNLVNKSTATIASIDPSRPAEGIGPWLEVIRTAKPAVVEDVRESPPFPWRDHLLAQGVVTVLIVPMLIEGRVEGVIGIRFAERRAFREEELELARALASQAMLAMQLTRLSEQSRQAAVAQERNRMAREIHDTLAQGFTGILLQLGAAESKTTAEAWERARVHLDAARQLAKENLTHARRSVNALRPAVGEREPDLVGGLQEIAARARRVYDGRLEVSVSGAPVELAPDVTGELLRIAQEAVENATRHAEAGRIDVALRFTAAGGVAVSVRDDGSGFDIDQPPTGGFGLVSMSDRASAIGASIEFATEPGKGTAVRVDWPALPRMVSNE